MRQSLTIVTPAPDLSLLTIAQLRAAADISLSEQGRDAELIRVGAAIAADIATACNIAGDGVHAPTLRRETITETIWNDDRPGELFLSRRFVTSISMLTQCGAAVVSSDFALDGNAGMVCRFANGRPSYWLDGQTTVTYVAGFDVVPADLQEIAIDLVRVRLSAACRDPLVKGESVEVPGVQTRRTDYWVGSLPGAGSTALPTDIMARLARFRNISVY